MEIIVEKEYDCITRILVCRKCKILGAEELLSEHGTRRRAAANNGCIVDFGGKTHTLRGGAN